MYQYLNYHTSNVHGNSIEAYVRADGGADSR
jgi:hypothetical protein